MTPAYGAVAARSRQGAPLEPASHRPEEAEAMNGIGAGKFGRAAAVDAVGENFDGAAARRQFVGEAGHQHLDAAEVGAETLRGDGDQKRTLRN